MYEMFAYATSFNGNLEGWNVSKVTNCLRLQFAKSTPSKKRPALPTLNGA